MFLFTNDHSILLALYSLLLVYSPLYTPRSILLALYSSLYAPRSILLTSCHRHPTWLVYMLYQYVWQDTTSEEQWIDTHMVYLAENKKKKHLQTLAVRLSAWWTNTMCWSLLVPTLLNVSRYVRVVAVVMVVVVLSVECWVLNAYPA